TVASALSLGPGPLRALGIAWLPRRVPGPAVKSPVAKLVVTVLAVATSLLLYEPVVFVIVIESPAATPVNEKLAAVNVATVLPSYGFVGLPMMDAVSVFVRTLIWTVVPLTLL